MRLIRAALFVFVMKVADLQIDENFTVPAFLNLSDEDINDLTSQIVAYAKDSFGLTVEGPELLRLVMRHVYFLERGDPERASMTLDAALAWLCSRGVCHGQ